MSAKQMLIVLALLACTKQEPTSPSVAKEYAVSDAPYFSKVRIDTLLLGSKIIIRAGDGTRDHKEGRIEMLGVDDNSIEIGMWPGVNRTLSSGILTQISMYSKCYKCGGSRTSWSINSDGVGQVVYHDTDHYPDGYNMPVITAQGTLSNYDGSSGPVIYHGIMYGDRSDEIYLPDGRRVNLTDAIAAIVRHYPSEVGVR